MPLLERKRLRERGGGGKNKYFRTFKRAYVNLLLKPCEFRSINDFSSSSSLSSVHRSDGITSFVSKWIDANTQRFELPSELIILVTYRDWKCVNNEAPVIWRNELRLVAVYVVPHPARLGWAPNPHSRDQMEVHSIQILMRAL